MAENDEKFLLVSLNEKKAKKLAQIISNDTCRKIIDMLSEKEFTETEIAEKLKIPISTVHYNLQHLMKAKLITVDEFHYSKKGKEINHYKLANKFIIIAPRETTGIRDALRKILPIGLITVIGAAIIEFINSFLASSGAVMSKSFEAANTAAMERAAAPALMAADTATQAVAEVAPDVARNIANSSIWQHISIWFLLGGLTVMILYLLFEIIKNNRKIKNN